MKILFKVTLSILFIISTAWGNSNLDKLGEIKRLNKFIFASCNREFEPQPLWQYINQDSPQLFIWGGDNIYGDKKPNKNNHKMKYEILNNIEGYRNLTEKTPIIGIWDDHDYGENNGGINFKGKEASRRLFLDFIKEPKDSSRWKRNGIYTSYEFGEKDKKVKFILLDNRYNLSAETGILGSRQRDWLDNELKSSNAKIHFIVSGMPFLPASMFWTEEWSDYPNSKKLLLNMIEKYRVPGVVFLTGDKHFAAISKKGPILEIMSSGMTHNTNPIFRPLLKRRFSPTYFDLNYALIEIDWESIPIKLKATIKGVNTTAFTRTYTLPELNSY